MIHGADFQHNTVFIESMLSPLASQKLPGPPITLRNSDHFLEKTDGDCSIVDVFPFIPGLKQRKSRERRSNLNLTYL
jgi:hypothetical protein